MTTPEPAPRAPAHDADRAHPDPRRCESCGGPHASAMDTPDGPARLCPVCATLHGLGCP